MPPRERAPAATAALPATEASGEARPFGAVLKRRRLAAGLTHEALAERAGVSVRAISDLERGVNRTPRRETLALLAGALQLPPDQRATFETAARPPAPPPLPPAPLAPDVPAGPRHNLPRPLTSFVGREQERREVARLLQTARLVTLTGPGGCGKTRLALQVAADLLEQVVDGVYLVSLEPLRDPARLPEAIAQTLSIGEAAGQPLQEQLTQALRDRELLLVLDNFEHLLASAPSRPAGRGATQVVAALLTGCPRLKLLVTSRAALRAYGEHEFPVPGLALPDLTTLPPVERLIDYAALRLFLARARAVRPDFQLTAQNGGTLALICHRLDGLPLALELAAARIRLLTPDQLLARLEHRLPLLTGGASTLPARQQTLRAAIAWSYDLLAPAEQHLLQRLSVFVAGCTLAAAEAVCRAPGDASSDFLDGLDALTAKSLLRRTEPEGGEPRLILLETIREYVLERRAAAGGEALLRQAHARYFLAVAERAGPELVGPHQAAWSVVCWGASPRSRPTAPTPSAGSRC